MKFRKRPVVIEAFQMTKERRWDNSEWPTWLHEAWRGELGAVNSIWAEPNDSGVKERLLSGLIGMIGLFRVLRASCIPASLIYSRKPMNKWGYNNGSKNQSVKRDAITAAPGIDRMVKPTIGIS